MSVLVLQPHGVGEAIYTTPTIKAAWKCTNQKVTVACNLSNRAVKMILERCPGCSGVHDMHDVDKIKMKEFSFVLVCSGVAEYIRLAREYNPRRVLAPVVGDKSQHIGAYFFVPARDLGFRGSIPAPSLPVKKTSIECQGPKLALGIGYLKPGEAPAGVKERKRWGKAKKHWGDSNFAGLAKLFATQGGTAFLVGDRKDQQASGQDIVRQAGGTVTTLCGRLPFDSMLGTIAACDMYVGNDTALTHAASLLDVPCLDIVMASSIERWAPLKATKMKHPKLADVWDWVTKRIGVRQ